MPQSFANVIVQFVFSTKDRVPFIDAAIRPQLHAYLATVCREATNLVYAVGGTADHVHIATILPRTMTIADIVEKVKVASSAWIKEMSPKYRDFYWQRGYGCFSVGASGKDALVAYVQNQEDHHKTLSFQDEYRALLTKYHQKWDERYVWD